MIFYTLDCLKFVWFCFVAADTLNNKVIFRRNVQWGMSLLRLWIEMNHRICFKGNETFLGEWLLNNVPLDIVQSILASDPWCHGMEMLSALLALCEGNPQVTGGFPPHMVSNAPFDVFFNVSLNKRLNKHSSCRVYEMR